jgi:hypothetical protein
VWHVLNHCTVRWPFKVNASLTAGSATVFFFRSCIPVILGSDGIVFHPHDFGKIRVMRFAPSMAFFRNQFVFSRYPVKKDVIWVYVCLTFGFVALVKKKAVGVERCEKTKSEMKEYFFSIDIIEYITLLLHRPSLLPRHHHHLTTLSSRCCGKKKRMEDACCGIPFPHAQVSFIADARRTFHRWLLHSLGSRQEFIRPESRRLVVVTLRIESSY